MVPNFCAIIEELWIQTAKVQNWVSIIYWVTLGKCLNLTKHVLSSMKWTYLTQTVIERIK